MWEFRRERERTNPYKERVAMFTSLQSVNKGTVARAKLDKAHKKQWTQGDTRT